MRKCHGFRKQELPLAKGSTKKQVSRSQASARSGFIEARLLQGLASFFLLIYLRNILEIFLNLLVTHLIVLQITIEIAFVRWHINQAMT